jgi:hypothetical protein
MGIKLRRMELAGRATYMGDIRNTFRIWLENI